MMLNDANGMVNSTELPKQLIEEQSKSGSALIFQTYCPKT